MNGTFPLKIAVKIADERAADNVVARSFIYIDISKYKLVYNGCHQKAIT